ncbi:hypothetical protein [Hydrogenimonas sp.]
MYHYLKWAALSLFFKRNMRYLVLIAVGLTGIYIADAVYGDMADFAVKSGHTERIATYLAFKWSAVALFAVLILFSVTRLGFGSGSPKTSKRKKEEEKISQPQEDPILRRLEKFKTPEKLRHRSDLVIERKRKRRWR